MSTPTDTQNETADGENVVASERDISPPVKVIKTDCKGSVAHDTGKHIETICSQRSERSDDDLCTGDAVKLSGTDSDRSDSPAAESDRITPPPKFEYNASDSSEEATRITSDRGDFLEDLENITESSDSSYNSPEHSELDKSSELQEPSGHPRSPPAGNELPEFYNGQTTPRCSQANRVNSLRKRMAVYSPSDNILSPCTMKLNRMKNFFRVRHETKNLSLLSAEELNEINDDSDDGQMEGTPVFKADGLADNKIDKAADEDTGSTKNQEDSDHSDV